MNRDEIDQNEIAKKLQDIARIEEVLAEATRRAVAEHARAGRKIPAWRNNQVVWEIPPVQTKPDLSPDR